MMSYDVTDEEIERANEKQKSKGTPPVLLPAPKMDECIHDVSGD
jgi:hypothetical protein